jgi:adenine phosphoribosyltransferase
VTDPRTVELLDTHTRVIPDFPEPGILFRDLTPVFADPAAFASVIDALTAPFEGAYDIVAGVEARGFALAAGVAARSGHGLLLIRKAGKLPGETLRESYALEYGEAVLEVHTDQLPSGSRVLLVDDVLATGGTLAASQRLIERAGWVLAGTAVVLELDGLGGREKLAPLDVVALQTV